MKNNALNLISKNFLVSLISCFVATSAEAAVTYNFLNGAPFDGGTGPVSLAASDSLTDGIYTFNLNTFDIIGLDNGTTGALTSTKAGAAHATNIFNDSTGLGVFSRETTNAIDDGNSFDYGEAWQFTFDNDVIFNAANVSLLEGSQTFTFTVLDGSNGGSGTAFNLNSGANTINYSTVSSGTVMEFRAGTSSERARLGSITVTAVPEPGTMVLMLVALSGLLLFRRRK